MSLLIPNSNPTRIGRWTKEEKKGFQEWFFNTNLNTELLNPSTRSNWATRCSKWLRVHGIYKTPTQIRTHLQKYKNSEDYKRKLNNAKRINQQQHDNTYKGAKYLKFLHNSTPKIRPMRPIPRRPANTAALKNASIQVEKKDEIKEQMQRIFLWAVEKANIVNELKHYLKHIDYNIKIEIGKTIHKDILEHKSEEEIYQDLQVYFVRIKNQII